MSIRSRRSASASSWTTNIRRICSSRVSWGLATGLGVGSLLGVSVGLALGISSRIVFGIEALIGLTILGIIQGGLEERLVGSRLLLIGLTFLALGLAAVTFIYLTPTLK